MEKLPLGKALTLRVTQSPVGALVFAINDPTTHKRLFTGSAENLAKLYPTPGVNKPAEKPVAKSSGIWDKLTGKDSEQETEPELTLKP